MKKVKVKAATFLTGLPLRKKKFIGLWAIYFTLIVPVLIFGSFKIYTYVRPAHRVVAVLLVLHRIQVRLIEAGRLLYYASNIKFIVLVVCSMYLACKKFAKCFASQICIFVCSLSNSLRNLRNWSNSL